MQMNTKILIFGGFALLFLSACGGRKQQDVSSAELIQAAEKFDYDTVAVTPGDTLCSSEVDDVLRHYPEFYHATKNAKKRYEAWAQQEKTVNAKAKPELMDINVILDKTLHGKMTVTSDSVWTALPAIDSLYLQRIGKVPDNAPNLDARKTEIGRARKAWQLYVEQLHRLSAAVPEACRERFLRIVADQTDKYLTTLQK